MPAVVNDGKMCTGHGCWPSRPNATCSHKFFIQGRGVVRIGDQWQVHCCTSCHPGTQATGSHKLYVQGKAVARIGDSISCGSHNMTGSSKMYCQG